MTRKINLLIVDDEEDFLDAIARRLELRDFEVTTASDGAQALKAARKGRFDLALLDLRMPGMDGREVLQVLKKEHRYIEVVILTGHGSFDSAVECTKAGAFDYLPKPYELEGLIEVLKEAYKHRLERKFKDNHEIMAKLGALAQRELPLNVLRHLRELDDDEK
jgi:DNA-binding NtrC family response regulator